MSDSGTRLQKRSPAFGKDDFPRLADNLAGLRETWGRARSAGCDSEEFRDLHRSVHGLTGFGASSGLEEMSNVARRLEQLAELLIGRGGPLSDEQDRQVERLIDSLEATFADEERAVDARKQDRDQPARYSPPAEGDARLQAVRAGSAHFFTKPLDLDKLGDALDELTTGAHEDPYRILVVDDDQTLADFFALTLRSAGMSVATENDPLQVLDVLDAFRPELILMDVCMPGRSGVELAAIIRQQERFSGVAMVFLSTETGFDRQLAAVNMGGEDFLTKPIYPGYLIATVSARVIRARTLNVMTNNLLAATRGLENQKSALDLHAILSVTDVDGRIIHVNDKFTKVSGYSCSEVLGEKLEILYPSDHEPERDAEMWRRITRGRVWRGEIRNRAKNGELYWTDATVVPFMDAALKPYQFVFIQNDVTARLLAEEALRIARDAKSDFLSRLSHQLRAPLNAVMGFSQLLEMVDGERLSTSQTDHVGEIRRAAEHLLDLINGNLDLARIEAGKLQLDLSSVPVVGILEESCSLIGPLAEQRGITVHKNYATIGDAMARADPTRLKQIVVSLLSNAVKHDSIGGSVEIKCEPQTGGKIRIDVIGTGVGIPVDQCDGLIQPFARLEMHEREVGAAGIGLALSKGLAELMGGEIGIESAPESGTRLWVELPRVFVDKMANQVAASSNRPKVQDGGEHLPCTVLYVEDNEANFALIREIVKMRPYIDLIHADTAEAGIALCGVHRPNLFLLDLQLPGMDGFEALKTLRTIDGQRDTPAVAVSADAGPAHVQRALEAGFEEYITKPIDVLPFLKVIDGLTALTGDPAERQAGSD